MTHPIFENNARFLRLSFDKRSLSAWADEIFDWLFSIHPRYSRIEVFLSKEAELKQDLQHFIREINAYPGDAAAFVREFFNQLPVIHGLLKSDLETIFISDPAARSIDEVLFSYPGFYAVAIHRLAHALFLAEVKIIPRLLSEYAHFKTGIDIHSGARIGERFLIDHGTGVVIGETCEIGNDVKIYQGVTLGALSVSRKIAGTKRHPTIGNRVVIYANATILGGNTVIGDDSVIGGNVWTTQSIPDCSLVFHKSEIIIKTNQQFPEPLNFII
ncbi:MAG: serine acetyltransferase [Bacteroidales bacterium]|nr:serine acetyltransferase [Bacteroidales bacterium]